MKKLDLFKQTFQEFELMTIAKWKARCFNYHKGHLNILKYAWYVKMTWLTKKGVKMIKEQFRYYTILQNTLFNVQLKLF